LTASQNLQCVTVVGIAVCENSAGCAPTRTYAKDVRHQDFVTSRDWALRLQASAVMSRDQRKLEAFQWADSLVIDMYRAIKTFPPDERYGFQAQIRRTSLKDAHDPRA